MSVYTYKQILSRAKTCKKNVRSKYLLGITSKWSYYFAKSILNPKEDITRIDFVKAPNAKQDIIGRQAIKSEYMGLVETYVEFVESHNRLPNYIEYKGLKVAPRLFTYVLAKILVNYNEDGKFQNKVNINHKVFVKPTETTNGVLAYFIKKFGKVSTIDEALGKVDGKGYGHYYDDHKSNKQTIDAMANNTNLDDPNCVDSSHVFYNVGKGLDYDVHCIHVKCKGGDGHVRLKLRHKKHTNNQWIYRDPACVISDNGKGVGCNWCMDGAVIATDPSWFMENLNR